MTTNVLYKLSKIERTMKQHNIKTVQDMIDCTNEANINNFIKDLTEVIKAAHTIRDLEQIVGGNKDEVLLENEGFTWIDDDENNIEITIRPSEI